MQLEIRIKKYGISNRPDVCIFDDPCLFVNIFFQKVRIFSSPREETVYSIR